MTKMNKGKWQGTNEHKIIIIKLMHIYFCRWGSCCFSQAAQCHSVIAFSSSSVNNLPSAPLCPLMFQYQFITMYEWRRRDTPSVVLWVANKEDDDIVKWDEMKLLFRVLYFAQRGDFFCTASCDRNRVFPLASSLAGELSFACCGCRRPTDRKHNM